MTREARSKRARANSFHLESPAGRMELEKRRPSPAPPNAIEINFQIGVLQQMIDENTPPQGKTVEDVQKSIKYWQKRLGQVQK